MRLKIAAALIVATGGFAGNAFAQTPAPADRPTVGKYLADGYTVQRSEIGNPFLQFILQKIDRFRSGAGLVLGAGADRRNVELPHHQVSR